MGKKKKTPSICKYIWCYYCDREFESEKILIQHQKAKHFKCHVCHKKLSTASGMVIHILQVHKVSIVKVPNSTPERESIDLEIFGMEGIPQDLLAKHNGYVDIDDNKNHSKFAKVEVPHASPFVVATMGTGPQPHYATIQQHVYVPTSRPGVVRSPFLWHPGPALPQGYIPSIPPPLLPTYPNPRPLFPIQSQIPLPSHPLYPIRPPLLPPSSKPKSILPLQLSQQSKLHPSYAIDASVPNIRSPLENKFSQSAPLRSSTMPSPTTISITHGAIHGEQQQPTPSSESYMYSSASNTTLTPSIGPPPMISNTPHLLSSQGAIRHSVHLIWDDNDMSMEERRALYPSYQVLSETLQMNSIDAAVDKRILASDLSGCMNFKA